jgi:hypothetical protein
MAEYSLYRTVASNKLHFDHSSALAPAQTAARFNLEHKLKSKCSANPVFSCQSALVRKVNPCGVLVSFIGVFTQFAHYESVCLANEHSPPAMTNCILYGLTAKCALFAVCQKLKICICKYVTLSTGIVCGVMVVWVLKVVAVVVVVVVVVVVAVVVVVVVVVVVQ